MSAKADKHKRELRAYAKRREHRPEPTVMQHVSLQANRGLENRMIQDYTDVLQNVEFSLVTAAKESAEIDDHVVERILRHAINQLSTEDPIVLWAMDFLATMRQQRSDITDAVWRNALRVVYTSLKRHSSCQPREMSYLHFVSQYIL